MNPDHRISACITAGNEERNIRRCLQSLTWCDEIIVMDSFSTDRTVEISREFTSRVYQHEWMGYIGQKRLVLELATQPWVLFLDADEEISPEARDEIRAAIAEDNGRYAGYLLPRIVRYLGQWIRHGEWYPDLKLRLFRRGQGVVRGREPHDHIAVDGPVRRLRHPIHHFTYDDLRDHLNTVNRFSTISAREKYESGKRVRVLDITLRPVHRFLKAYFVHGGVLDGRRGFLIAMISAFEVMLKYAKLWELQQAPPVETADAPSPNALPPSE